MEGMEMSQQQFDTEVMAELEIMEYNTNLGIYHFLGVNSCESAFIHSTRNCSTDGQIREMGQEVMY
jgi:hypothetical protein